MVDVQKNIEIIEATSKVDDNIVMTFNATVDKKNPQNSTLEIKKKSEGLYRKFRQEASLDRESFENYIFSMINTFIDCKTEMQDNTYCESEVI